MGMKFSVISTDLEGAKSSAVYFLSVELLLTLFCR